MDEEGPDPLHIFGDECIGEVDLNALLGFSGFLPADVGEVMRSDDAGMRSDDAGMRGADVVMLGGDKSEEPWQGATEDWVPGDSSSEDEDEDEDSSSDEDEDSSSDEDEDEGVAAAQQPPAHPPRTRTRVRKSDHTEINWQHVLDGIPRGIENKAMAIVDALCVAISSDGVPSFQRVEEAIASFYDAHAACDADSVVGVSIHVFHDLRRHVSLNLSGGKPLKLNEKVCAFCSIVIMRWMLNGIGEHIMAAVWIVLRGFGGSEYCPRGKLPTNVASIVKKMAPLASCLVREEHAPWLPKTTTSGEKVPTVERSRVGGGIVVQGEPNPIPLKFPFAVAMFAFSQAIIANTRCNNFVRKGGGSLCNRKRKPPVEVPASCTVMVGVTREFMRGNWKGFFAPKNEDRHQQQ